MTRDNSASDLERGHPVQRIAREPIARVSREPVKRIKRIADKPPRKPDPCFAMIPRDVIWPPPIAHRHTPANRRFVTPFEFAILGAVLIEARAGLAGRRSDLAYAHGGDKIALEKQHEKSYRARWAKRREDDEAPVPRRYNTFNADQPVYGSEALKQAGQEGNQARYRALRKGPAPAVATLTLRRSQLLRWAYLPANGTNLARLPQVLDRLTQPVGNQAGLLLSWQEADGALELNIWGEWLPIKSFTRVPLPLPTSPAALALFLFLQQVDTRQGKRNKRGEQGAMNRKTFAELLGVPTRHGAQVINRALKAAFAAVNQHLERLPTLQLQKVLKLGKGGFPNRVTYKMLPNDQIRITTWQKCEDLDEPETKPKTKPATKPKQDPFFRGGLQGYLQMLEKLEKARYQVEC